LLEARHVTPALRSLIDAWVGRRARPSREALAAVAGREPATVVTGASRGIGLALARRFAEAGDTIVLVARRAGPLEDAAAALARDHRVKTVPVALDITATDAPAAIEQALADHGLYGDRLINNAGIGLTGAFFAHDAEDIDRLIALNVTALTRLTRHALGEMRARGRGGILNVASLGGYTPGPYQAAYYASKAYVISLTEAIAAETAGAGVRIAVLAPGPVATGFHAAMGAEAALYRALIPALSPERVARAAYRGFMLGRRVIVPGVLGTPMAYALRIIPHPILVPLIGVLLDPASLKPISPKDAGK
ncbi:MAG TPA: SDR family oxidoreductase, partial [Hyphomicrobiaceae bacterium]|nr:SDR family oxidoreductase [Hyphomicrobiaceae bacterium]